MQQQLAAQEQRQLKEDRRQAQREEDRRQDDDLRKDQIWERLLARSTDSRSEAESPHSLTCPSERIATFRRLEKGEDVETYFAAFEAHMECYSLPRHQWTRNLIPILPPEATQVYVQLDTESRQDYDILKGTLFGHYRITRETYRQKMDQFRRKTEETWSMCARRHNNLAIKWTGGCTTVTEVLELVSTDALLKLMPRQMATHVRDGKPKTLEAAANLADDFVITRGWTYNVVTESDRSANQGRQHKKDERAHHLGEQHSSEVKQKSPNPQESTGKKSDQNGRGVPKFDKQNRPRCFECNQYGHFTAECHGKRRDGSKPKLEAINFAKPLTPRQESDLVITEVNRQTLVSGTVNGKSVNRVLLDTGAE